MNEPKRIIVEFGARRQQFLLNDHLISISKLLYIINNCFDILIDKNSLYLLQIYDYILNEYKTLDDYRQIIDVEKDIKHLHRFRIINKSFQSQKYYLLNNLQSTVGKLQNATRDIDKIQNLVGSLNSNCDILNQGMNSSSSNSSTNPNSSKFSYLIDPSTMKTDIDITNISINNDSDDENFESVSCFDNPQVYLNSIPPPISTVTNSNKQHLSMNQTRIIPCKYAVRGTCNLGDKCLYLHDETCIQSAREWERRL